MRKFLPLFILLAINITLVAQNQAPTAVNDNYVVFEELPYPLRPLDNDTDPENDPLTWYILNGPFRGIIDTGLFNTILYRGDPDFFGPDIIFYRACDNASPPNCDNGTIFINVTNINDAPIAADDTFNVNEDGTILMNVLANDDDPDFDPLVITAITQNASHGLDSITPNKRIRYTPNPNYNGPDELRYRICDTTGGAFTVCDVGRVTINVIPVNDKPIAVADTLVDSLAVDSFITVDLVVNDIDIDGDQLHVVEIISGSGISDSATIVIDSVGTVTITPGACGVDSFWYVICDASKCDTGVVYLTVVCPPVPIDTTPDTTIIVPQDLILTEGFSPDGDGYNDVLVFKGLQTYQPASLKVFNRLGNIVYQTDNYENNWDGNDLDSHKPLPDGTYYYVLKLANGKSFVNYLVLLR